MALNKNDQLKDIGEENISNIEDKQISEEKMIMVDEDISSFSNTNNMVLVTNKEDQNVEKTNIEASGKDNVDMGKQTNEISSTLEDKMMMVEEGESSFPNIDTMVLDASKQVKIVKETSIGFNGKVNLDKDEQKEEMSSILENQIITIEEVGPSNVEVGNIFPQSIEENVTSPIILVNTPFDFAKENLPTLHTIDDILISTKELVPPLKIEEMIQNINQVEMQTIENEEGGPSTLIATRTSLHINIIPSIDETSLHDDQVGHPSNLDVEGEYMNTLTHEKITPNVGDNMEMTNNETPSQWPFDDVSYNGLHETIIDEPSIVNEVFHDPTTIENVKEEIDTRDWRGLETNEETHQIFEIDKKGPSRKTSMFGELNREQNLQMASFIDDVDDEQETSTPYLSIFGGSENKEGFLRRISLTAIEAIESITR
jgi:hypothetical protein